jgi:hypothetical protein
MKLIAATAAATVVAFAGLATAQTSTQPPEKRPGPVSVRGCLAAGSAANQFTLAAASDENKSAVGTSGSTGTPATTSKPVVKTITYMLTPARNVDLKSLVGHTVEVTGVESSPVNEDMNSTTTPATTAPGDVKGGAKAKVQTSAKADIVVKQLNVSAVRSVADTCTMQK